MTIQNIIFDLGGVLIEWNPQKLVQNFSSELAVQNNLLENVLNHPDWAEKDRGTISPQEGIVRFAHYTGLSTNQISDFMHQLKASLQLKAETVTLMDELKAQDFGLYCLSNMPDDHYQLLRKKYDFWNRFDGIIISGLVRLVKPEAAIYQYLLDTYHLDADSCLFIDDSPQNIQVAQSLGIRGIIFSDIESCRKQLHQVTL
jgi:putative hydrolase of the HAD superfamily